MLENLKAATFDVFETMFFLFPEPIGEHEAAVNGFAFQAWTPVAGPKSFQVGLTVPLPLAQKMAANFLGLEEGELAGDKLEDMLREAAAMVAGNFLSREQVSAAFHLEPPQSSQLDGQAHRWRPHAHCLLFILEGHPLEVFLERIRE